MSEYAYLCVCVCVVCVCVCERERKRERERERASNSNRVSLILPMQNDPGSQLPDDNRPEHFFTTYLKARISCQRVVPTPEIDYVGAINYHYDVMSKSTPS